MGSISGLGRSPGGGHDNPLQESCLENPHGQRSLAGYRLLPHAKSRTWLERLSIHTLFRIKSPVQVCLHFLDVENWSLENCHPLKIAKLVSGEDWKSGHLPLLSSHPASHRSLEVHLSPLTLASPPSTLIRPYCFYKVTRIHTHFCNLSSMLNIITAQSSVAQSCPALCDPREER